jgi:hypothetical protein
MLPGKKIVESLVLVSAVTLWYSDGDKLYCLAVCSWAPNHGAHLERHIPPRGAGEAPNAEWNAGRDLARLGAP